MLTKFDQLKNWSLSLPKKHLVVVLVYALLSLILIVSWFRYGYLYGGGDVGLPSYDPKRIFEIAKYIWWEASAPGTTVPHGLTSVPLQFFQSILANLGLPYFLIQAVLFWILLFTMGYGMFWVGLNIFGLYRFRLAILSGLFYMFSPYIEISVWHRFVHPTFFLAAALPFIFLFWKKWIEQGRYWWLLLFLLTNFFATYLYGTLAFIATILILLILMVLANSLFPWKGIGSLGNMLHRFIIGTVALFLIHSWWLLPSFNVGPATFTKQHSVGENLTTLLSISQQAIVPYSLLGINPFYIYDELDWGKIYNLPIFRLLALLSLVFLIPGFVKSLTNKNLVMWALFLLLGLFLAKGAASPFGYIYVFFFSNIFALGVLRNPFEKLGILIPFASAILFSVGINFYYEYFKQKYLWLTKILIAVILFLLCGVFLWPVWTGKLFGKYDRPAFVEIPQSYIETDQFIKSQSKDGNILHLPLTTGEAATYYWKYGYNGVEPSQLLFRSLPSISHGFNLTYVDDALRALAQSFMSFPTDRNRIISLMQSFNIRFVVLHKDMEWRGGYLYNPQKLEEILEKLEFLKRGGKFGDLVVYELKDEFFVPKLRLSEDIQYLDSSEDNLYWPWLVAQRPAELLSPLDPIFTDVLLDQSSEIVLMPKYTYFYLPYTASKENVEKELPTVRILPDSPLYPLISLKEKISLLTMPQTDRFVYRATLAGKRLVEVYKISKKGSLKSISSILSSYQQLLPFLKEGIIERKGGGLFGGEVPLESIFARHFALLDQLYLNVLEDEKQVVAETRDKLITMLKSSRLLPDFDIRESPNLPNSNRLIHKFEVPSNGNYEILQAHQNSQSVYAGELKNVDLQIDDQIKNFSGTLKDHFISYGTINLSKGLHEISYYSALSSNLVKSQVGIVQREGEYEVMSETHSPKYMEFEIEPLTGDGFYQLSFESWIKLGDKFRVQLIQDSDPKDPKGIEERLYSFNKTYLRDPYQNFWNNYVVNLHIRPTTQQASIRFLVEPWNDCRAILVEKKLCESKQVRFPFEHPSSIAFKNIELKRALRNPLFLRALLPKKSTNTVSESINFKRLSPVKYSGQFNIESPQFLIFSETYHPGWRLKLNDGKKEYALKPNYMANLFGSSWYIKNPGDYTFVLEFTPQNYVKSGILFSSLGFLGVIILLLRQKFKDRQKRKK